MINATGPNLAFLKPHGGHTGSPTSKALDGLEELLGKLKKACDEARSASQDTQNSPPGFSLDDLIRKLFGQGDSEGAGAGQGSGGSQGAGAGQGSGGSQGAGAGQGAEGSQGAGASQGPEGSQGPDQSGPPGGAQKAQDSLLDLLSKLVELLKAMQSQGQGQGQGSENSELKPTV